LENDIKNSRVLQDSVTGKAIRDEHGNAVMLPEREISLDKLISEDWDFASAEPSPESIVTDNIQIEELHRCLDQLESDERVLIDALFFGGMTEREYALTIGISKTALHARKNKVLEKIKYLFGE
jgi:RNA polymerase sigma factor (sigma-70 family)